MDQSVYRDKACFPETEHQSYVISASHDSRQGQFILELMSGSVQVVRDQNGDRTDNEIIHVAILYPDKDLCGENTDCTLHLIFNFFPLHVN